MSKRFDMVGKTFGEWTVQSRAASSKSRELRWDCVCSCGKTGVVSGYDLRRGRSASCGHDAKLSWYLQNIKDNTVFVPIGATSGLLTHIGAADPAAARTREKIRCRCACGNECDVGRVRFAALQVKSCGCLARQLSSLRLTSQNKARDRRDNMAGQRFGKLVVTGRSPTPDNVLAECDCGGTKDVRVDLLRSGKTKSCGCIKRGRKPVNQQVEAGARAPAAPVLETGLNTLPPWRR